MKNRGRPSDMVKLLCAWLALGWSAAAFCQDEPTAEEKSPKVEGVKPDVPAVEGEKPAVEAPDEEPKPAPTEEPPKLPSNSELPWKRPTPRLPSGLKPIESPLEYLELRGIALSEWERFHDGAPWGDDDRDPLLKLLLQFPRMGLAEVARWRKEEPDWNILTPSQATASRGQIFQLAGTVRRIEREDLIPELVEIYEFEHYFRLTWFPKAAADEGLPPRPLIAFVRRIPEGWKMNEDVAYPCSLDAIFLRSGKLTPEPADEPLAYFAGDRAAWHPAEPIEELGITAQHVLLGKCGLDVGLLPDLKDSDGHPFEDVDRDPFYQTLSATSKMTSAQWESAGVKPLEIAKLLSAPKEHRLELTQVEGNVRRIVKVLAEDEDLKQRYGITHYYEVDFFILLGDQAVKLGPDTKEGKAPIYYNEFPATLCVLELPAGVKEGDVNIAIKTPAAFYRVWSYKSEYIKSFNSKGRQIAPMFLAKSFSISKGPVLAVSRTDLMVGAIGLTVLGAIGALAYYATRKRKSDEPPEKLGHIA